MRDAIDDENERLRGGVTAFCQSDSLSEDGLLNLFDQLRLTPGNHNRLSNYEFFRRACHNERVTEGIIRLLLEYFPDAVSANTYTDGLTPLHCACYNKNVTLSFIELLINAAPDSFRDVDGVGRMPLHYLCGMREFNEKTALEILNLLIKKYPGAAQHGDNNGRLPIHLACLWRSPEFCRVLIEAYPGSVSIPDGTEELPLHNLCNRRDGDEASAMKILKLLIRKYPEAVTRAAHHGILPIHIASRYRSGEFCQVLIHAAPDSVRRVDNGGRMPLHYLCSRSGHDDDEAAALQVLKLLIEKYPEAAQHSNVDGVLPIYIASASRWRSPEFCRLLIEAYPGSERISIANNGALLLHSACSKGSLDTVKYLYRQYPDAIDHATTAGLYPIHYAIVGMMKRDDPATALEVVKFLLNCDPNQKLMQHEGWSLLCYACGFMTRYNDNVSNIEAGIQLMKVLFDAHPEAIENNGITSNIHRFDQQVQAFINSELVYARLAKDHRLMTTADDNGQLPLHRALQINVRLGSIKLLVNGNPLALRAIDNDFAMPLHIACEHHDSAGVVPYLIERHTLALEAVDRQGNTALHYACRGAKHGNIGLLLETYDAVSVSKRNADGKLPIDLLWESNEVSDRESVEYTGSVFRLLRANPEMINQ